MSVNRKNYISKKELEQKIANKLQLDEKRGKKRHCSGVVIAKCSDIKNLIDKKNELERRGCFVSMIPPEAKINLMQIFVRQ